jgi:tetratricopeptide (TPR) repeat protein/TolB-like protein
VTGAARLAVCAVLLACAGAAACGDERPGPAVPPALAVIGIGEERQSPEARALQDGLVHLVQSDLASRSAARIVSRGRTALLLDELGMTASQLTEAATSQRFGQAVSADYLVLVQLARGDGLSARVTVARVTGEAPVWEGTVAATTPEVATLAEKVVDSLIGALHLSPPRAAAGGLAAAPALAVLDFRSEGPASALDQHAQDLADLLCANLTALGVPLVERRNLSAVLAEMGLSAAGLVKTADMAKVGRLLGAERMLDTSMIVAGEEVVLDGQLIQPATGLVVGSCRVVGRAPQLPALVQRLATETAQALQVPVTEEGRRGLAEQATTSLEAALHAAAGWRLGQAGQAEEAAAEYQQAIYLDPNAAGWWVELGRQYRDLDRMEEYAQTLRRYFATAEGKDIQALGPMAHEWSDAEIWAAHGAESEAAARLALRAHEDQHGYWKLMRALVVQRKLAEARQFCEPLVGRKDIAYVDFACAWGSFLGWFTEVVGEENAKEADVRQMLEAASRVLDVTRDGDESGMGVTLADFLLICSTGRPPDDADLDGRSVYLEECLALAKRMTSEFTHGVDIPARGWFVTGVLEYKLGRYGTAVAALQRCLRDYPEVNFDPGGPGIRAGASAGIVRYVLGRTYEQQGRRQEAIEAYRTVVMLLDSGRAQARDAQRRLQALGGEPPPAAPWLRRLSGAGRSLEGELRPRPGLAPWLRHEGYDLRDARLTAGDEAPLPLSAHGIQVLIWERRPSDFPPVDDLRAYVAGGGNLLICLSSQPPTAIVGPTLATSSGTLDFSLNWVLPAFGLRMSDQAREASSVPVESLGTEPALALGTSPAYGGMWFPLQAPPGMAVVTVGSVTGDLEPEVVAAIGRAGLGKVAVVSLRDWVPGADAEPDKERDPWQYALLSGLLDWFAKDDLPRRYPQAAAQWAAARDAAAAGDYGAAVASLDRAEVTAPSGPDARYWAACLLADKLGDRDGAARRWREVAASEGADPWLVRMANLRLGVAAVRAGDERNALPFLQLAAGEQPDALWGQARLAIGDLRLAQGDYLGAAQAFREVADELGHSEERFRALFGLAYALGKQANPEASARVYEAVAVEFGKAPLPADMDARWPDPWPTYFPQEKRPDEPTVADAVAAAGPASQ